MRRYLLLLAAVLGTLASASAQSVFSCPSGFSSSGSCGVSLPGASGQPFLVVGTTNGSTPALNGSQVDLIPSGATHAALSLNYQKLVNVNSFTASFTFVPNGQNIAFVLQNSNNMEPLTVLHFLLVRAAKPGFTRLSASSEPNNIFALELDSWSYLGSVQSFSYSSAQIYQSGQSPCNPNDSGPNYTLIDKISTSPVPLNSPASSQGTSTGDTYSATVTYNGSTLTLNLYDVTAGGSCPGPVASLTHGMSIYHRGWAAIQLTWALRQPLEKPQPTRSISVRLATPKDRRRRQRLPDVLSCRWNVLWIAECHTVNRVIGSSHLLQHNRKSSNERLNWLCFRNTIHGASHSLIQ